MQAAHVKLDSTVIRTPQPISLSKRWRYISISDSVVDIRLAEGNHLVVEVDILPVGDNLVAEDHLYRSLAVEEGHHNHPVQVEDRRSLVDLVVDNLHIVEVVVVHQKTAHLAYHKTNRYYRAAI